MFAGSGLSGSVAGHPITGSSILGTGVSDAALRTARGPIAGQNLDTDVLRSARGPHGSPASLMGSDILDSDLQSARGGQESVTDTFAEGNLQTARGQPGMTQLDSDFQSSRADDSVVNTAMQTARGPIPDIRSSSQTSGPISGSRASPQGTSVVESMQSAQGRSMMESVFGQPMLRCQSRVCRLLLRRRRLR